MTLGQKALCYTALSLLFLIIPGGVAGIIMIWAWFAHEVYEHAKLVERHKRYLEEKREANKKKGYIYID